MFYFFFYFRYISLLSLVSLLSHMGRIIPALYVVAFRGEPIGPFPEGCVGIGTEAANPLPIPFPSTIPLLKIFCKKNREEGILF
jgi:hypothetical protein